MLGHTISQTQFNFQNFGGILRFVSNKYPSRGWAFIGGGASKRGCLLKKITKRGVFIQSITINHIPSFPIGLFSIFFYFSYFPIFLQDFFWTSLRDILRTSVGHVPWSKILVRGRPHNLCRRRPQDAGKGRPMALYIGQYGDVLRPLHWDVLRTSYFNVLRTSVEDVLKTSVGDFPWRYIEDLMGTSLGRLLGTFSGRPWDVNLPSGCKGLFLLIHAFSGESFCVILS